MKLAEIRKAFAMPFTNPAFPPGPYRFVNREFFIITYRTDPKKLAEVVPEPLQIDPKNPIVKFEVIRMPDATGFGDFTEFRPGHSGDVRRKAGVVRACDVSERSSAHRPVLEVVSGVHILTDLTLGLGSVVHDYLA